MDLTDMTQLRQLLMATPDADGLRSALQGTGPRVLLTAVVQRRLELDQQSEPGDDEGSATGLLRGQLPS